MGVTIVFNRKDRGVSLCSHDHQHHYPTDSWRGRRECRRCWSQGLRSRNARQHNRGCAWRHWRRANSHCAPAHALWDCRESRYRCSHRASGRWRRRGCYRHLCSRPDQEHDGRSASETVTSLMNAERGPDLQLIGALLLDSGQQGQSRTREGSGAKKGDMGTDMETQALSEPLVNNPRHAGELLPRRQQFRLRRRPRTRPYFGSIAMPSCEQSRSGRGNYPEAESIQR